MRDVTGVRVKLGLAAVCGLGFAVLSLTVARPPTADLFDVELHSWFLSHRPAWLISLALDVTATGTSLALAAAIIVAALSLVRGRWSNKASSALILSAVLMTGVGLRLWLSDVIGRPRPSMSDWAGYASGFAFPSRHTQLRPHSLPGSCSGWWRDGSPASPGWSCVQSSWLGPLLSV